MDGIEGRIWYYCQAVAEDSLSLFDAVGMVLEHWLMQRSRGYVMYRRGMVSYVL